MKRFIFITLLLFSTNAFGEYVLEPANCTLKKKLIMELISITTKQEKHIFVN